MMKLKGKFLKTTIRPALLYRGECWATKKQYVQKVSDRDADVKMHVRTVLQLGEKIRNDHTCGLAGVTLILDQRKPPMIVWTYLMSTNSAGEEEWLITVKGNAKGTSVCSLSVDIVPMKEYVSCAIGINA